MCVCEVVFIQAISVVSLNVVISSFVWYWPLRLLFCSSSIQPQKLKDVVKEFTHYDYMLTNRKQAVADSRN